jgi:S-methylmethionine-dependent homocysteine/selenocysteine methylase
MRRRFPPQTKGTVYLTEGGQETEIMYKFGHDLPEFAMFPLLDRPAALAALRAMYKRYLEVAAAARLSVIIGGLDYRAILTGVPSLATRLRRWQTRRCAASTSCVRWQSLFESAFPRS